MPTTHASRLLVFVLLPIAICGCDPTREDPAPKTTVAVTAPEPVLISVNPTDTWAHGSILLSTFEKTKGIQLSWLLPTDLPERLTDTVEDNTTLSIELWRGPNVPRVLQLTGAAQPPLNHPSMKDYSIERAVVGEVTCVRLSKATPSRKGVVPVEITLRNVRFNSGTLKLLGPIRVEVGHYPPP